MNQKGTSLTRLVRDVYATQGDEIQCQEAAVQMVHAANTQMPDETSRQRYPALWHHFRFCPNCEREYRMLGELTHLEVNGQLVTPYLIPPPPDASRPSLWDLAQNTITAVFPGFQPVIAPLLTRAMGVSAIEPVEVVLADGLLSILLNVTPHEQDAGLQDLLCLISSADLELQEKIEGCSIWLQLKETGAVIQEQTISELGGGTFEGVSPGIYTLRLSVGGQEYAILGIDLL